MRSVSRGDRMSSWTAMPAENVVAGSEFPHITRTRSISAVAAFGARTGEDEGDSLTTEAGDAVDLACGVTQATRERSQRLVADLVSVAVVHVLEVVEVDDHERVAGLERLQRA